MTEFDDLVAGMAQVRDWPFRPQHGTLPVEAP
jgi:hypothetical protein